ncbi:MAG: hypothetical protein JO142_21195 [Burkholderiales bacterium]|nr:hypothetical protein [Burkholderiales bacterium]
MRDLRGFTYELEPLQRMREWAVRELRLELAKQHADAAALRTQIGQLQAIVAQMATEDAQQRAAAVGVHIDQLRVTHHYAAHIAEQLHTAQHKLIVVEAEADRLTAALHQQQKFLDGLADHREEAVKAFGHLQEKASMVEADDAWLRTTHWRSAA